MIKLFLWMGCFVVIFLFNIDHFIFVEDRNLCRTFYGKVSNQLAGPSHNIPSFIFSKEYRKCVLSESIQIDLIKKEIDEVDVKKNNTLLNLEKINSRLMEEVSQIGKNSFIPYYSRLLDNEKDYEKSEKDRKILNKENIYKIYKGYYPSSLLQININDCTRSNRDYGISCSFKDNYYEIYTGELSLYYPKDIFYINKFIKNFENIDTTFYINVRIIAHDIYDWKDVIQYKLIGFELSSEHVNTYFDRIKKRKIERYKNLGSHINSLEI
tara:strand:- start:461 stop:1264 length:804 start_codon:yes stop_codon:yes gene_type:complete